MCTARGRDRRDRSRHERACFWGGTEVRTGGGRRGGEPPSSNWTAPGSSCSRYRTASSALVPHRPYDARSPGSRWSSSTRSTVAAARGQRARDEASTHRIGRAVLIIGVADWARRSVTSGAARCRTRARILVAALQSISGRSRRASDGPERQAPTPRRGHRSRRARTTTSRMRAAWA